MATLNLQHIDKIYDNNVQAVCISIRYMIITFRQSLTSIWT